VKGCNTWTESNLADSLCWVVCVGMLLVGCGGNVTLGGLVGWVVGWVGYGCTVAEHKRSSRLTVVDPKVGKG